MAIFQLAGIISAIISSRQSHNKRRRRCGGNRITHSFTAPTTQYVDIFGHLFLCDKANREQAETEQVHTHTHTHNFKAGLLAVKRVFTGFKKASKVHVFALEISCVNMVLDGIFFF